MSDNNTLNLISKKRVNLLLGATGSVATIKLNEIVEGLLRKIQNISICILPTKNSVRFIEAFDETYNKQIPNLQDRLKFLKQTDFNEDSEPVIFSFNDEDEWSSWSKRNDPVLHIELRKWADLLVIAPLDANTMGKISNGICDNLLTSVMRAWDMENIITKPVIICPAMNTCMYTHPITRIQLNLLVSQFGFIMVDSIEKMLMCGDSGIGAMAKVDDIINSIFDVAIKIKIQN